MTSVWRVTKRNRMTSALRGEGAGLHPGRWNLAGDAVVYASSTPSLAMLEFLAHVDEEDAPSQLYLLQISLPRSARLLPANRLPRNWRVVPPPRSTQIVGSRWVDAHLALSLCVPSVLLPTRVDCNVLINVAHRDMQHVKIAAKIKFSFDRRILSTPRAV